MANEKKVLLIDNWAFKPNMDLVEDKRSEGGKLIVRGEFARAGVATENNRIYPRSLWEREIKRLGPAMESRKVMGEMDHPASGRTSLKNTSHLLTNLWLEGDVVMGEAEVLNTSAGRDAQAIIDATGHLGVSSRGFGTVRPNQEGKDVVQDDYRLQVFDFVADPANTSSYPTAQYEDKEQKKPVVAENAVQAKKAEKMTTDKIAKLSLESLRESNPTLYENLRDEAEREFEKRGAEIWAKKLMGAKEEVSTDLKTVFAENLKAAIEAAKKEFSEAERERLLSDPAVAGAKTALENLKTLLRPYIVPEDVESVVATKDKEIEEVNQKLAAAELKIANLTAENQELTSLAKEAGYKFHLESLLRNQEHAEVIRKMVGDVKQYENKEALNAKVAEIADEISKVSSKQEARDREMDELKKQNAVLKEAVEKSLEAANLMTVQVYAEERLRNHPKASQVRMMIEAVNPADKKGVDEILQKFREPTRDKTSLEEARARVRQMVGTQTVEYIRESEEPSADKANLTESNYNGLGNSVDMLRALSGMGDKN